MTDELTIRPEQTAAGDGERRSLWRDASAPALLAGLVCVVVSFSGHPLFRGLVAAALERKNSDSAHQIEIE